MRENEIKIIEKELKNKFEDVTIRPTSYAGEGKKIIEIPEIKEQIKTWPRDEDFLKVRVGNGNITSPLKIEISEKSIDSSISICYYYEEANIFDYLEAQEKGDKIWCYDSTNEPTLVEFTVTNTIENKSYIYSNTEVIISDDYWSMLESAKAEGMLEEVLDPENIAGVITEYDGNNLKIINNYLLKKMINMHI